MSWATAALKFESLAAQSSVDGALSKEIEAAVQDLDGIKVGDLARLLARASVAK